MKNKYNVPENHTEVKKTDYKPGNTLNKEPTTQK
jgi:hypothetical protein